MQNRQPALENHPDTVVGGFSTLPCHRQTTKNDGLPHGAAKPQPNQRRTTKVVFAAKPPCAKRPLSISACIHGGYNIDLPKQYGSGFRTQGGMLLRLAIFHSPGKSI